VVRVKKSNKLKSKTTRDAKTETRKTTGTRNEISRRKKKKE